MFDKDKPTNVVMTALSFIFLVCNDTPLAPYKINNRLFRKGTANLECLIDMKCFFGY